MRVARKAGVGAKMPKFTPELFLTFFDFFYFPKLVPLLKCTHRPKYQEFHIRFTHCASVIDIWGVIAKEREGRKTVEHWY